MKICEKILLTLSLLTIIGAIMILINEYRKKSNVWCSLKQAALNKELLDFKS